MSLSGPAAGDDALFVSDVHFGAGSPAADRAREERFLSFLERRAPATRRLFLLGDLFDFWFDYRHAIPRRPFGVVRRLADLAGRGVELHWIGGNHDFWADRFLRDELGARVYPGPSAVELAGRRLFLMHGDGMARGDLGYKLLKGMLRNRWTIAAYGALHPDIGIPLALRVSKWSRGSRDEENVDREWLYRQLALPRFAAGHDAVLTGHYHHPTHFRRDGRDFLVLGDWVRSFTYARLRGGTLALERWEGDAASLLSGGAGDYPPPPAVG
jgi:UDP-2,3-diacylglucosamine hydrolase